MKLRIALAVLQGLLIAIPAAHAADSGFYAGGGLGLSHTRLDQSADTQALNDALSGSGITASPNGKDEADLAFRVFVGYRLFRHAAVEVNYQDWGKAKENFRLGGAGSGTTVFSVEGRGFDASMLGLAPVNDDLELFGKFGVSFWNVKASALVTGPGGTFFVSEKATGASPLLGAGATWAVSDRVKLRAEWNHIHQVGKEESTGQGNVNLFGVALQLEFR